MCEVLVCACSDGTRGAWKELIPPEPLNCGWNAGILGLKANILGPFTLGLSLVWRKSCSQKAFVLGP